MSRLVKRICSMISPHSQRDADDIPTLERVGDDRKCHSLPRRRHSKHSAAQRSNSSLWNRMVTSVFGPEDGANDEFADDGVSVGEAKFYIDSVNGSRYQICGDVSW